MAKSLEDILDSLPAEQREKVERRASQLVAEELTLRELRKALNLTQGKMAELLKVKQGSVSKIEQRSDMLVSTLRSYIEAMGGQLDIIAKLPGHAPVKLEGFGDLEESDS